MKCPYCEFDSSKVIESRCTEDGEKVRRRRECENCGKRFTTYEMVENVPLIVVKRDGTREKFDRKKIFVFTMVIGIAYAISDEIHQIFVPMRGPVITDVLIDAVGVLLGALFVRALIKKHRRKRSDNGSKKG